jgi:hypothetical protein
MSFTLLLLFVMQVSVEANEPRPNCFIPDVIQVSYRGGTTDKQRRDFEQRVGLDSLCSGASSGYRIGHIVGEQYRYQVPAGHVGFWLKIFSMTPIVESSSEFKETASLKRETSVILDAPDPEPLPPWRIVESAGSVEQVRTKVTQFLRGLYQAGPGFHQLDCRSDCVHVTADQLKGVVIPSSGLWESVDIYVVITKGESRVNVLMIVDGYYATGVGSRPPSLSSYGSMELQYPREISQYADQLLGQLTMALQKRGGS